MVTNSQKDSAYEGIFISQMKVMKRVLILVVLFIIANSLFAQSKQHHIVFDFTKQDTASFSMMVRQARNIMNITGNAQLEIVCYGPGLDLLMKEKTNVQQEIQDLQAKFNVKFAACEFTMKRRGIGKSQLLEQVSTVPAAVLEISLRQQEGWTYIKAGY
jgi:intracellular sulfur oxidation DsrE/DsrF family protein